MFNNPRYLTMGIETEIPGELQILMWLFIDQLKEKPDFVIDYLQVFDLKEVSGEKNQEIIHRQEMPDYKEEYLLKTEKAVTTKVFVIDSNTDIPGESYSTMLLASEY